MGKCDFPGCQENAIRGFRLRPLPGYIVTCEVHGMLAEQAGQQARRTAISGLRGFAKRHIPQVFTLYKRTRLEQQDGA